MPVSASRPCKDAELPPETCPVTIVCVTRSRAVGEVSAPLLAVRRWMRIGVGTLRSCGRVGVRSCAAMPAHLSISRARTTQQSRLLPPRRRSPRMGGLSVTIVSERAINREAGDPARQASGPSRSAVPEPAPVAESHSRVLRGFPGDEQRGRRLRRVSVSEGAGAGARGRRHCPSSCDAVRSSYDDARGVRSPR